MIPPFDIFKIIPNEDRVLIESVQSLESAMARVKCSPRRYTGRLHNREPRNRQANTIGREWRGKTKLKENIEGSALSH